MEVGGNTPQSELESLRAQLQEARGELERLRTTLGIVLDEGRPPKTFPGYGPGTCLRTEIPGLFLVRGTYWLERNRDHERYRFSLRTRTWEIAKIRYAQWELDPVGWTAEWKRQTFSAKMSKDTLAAFLLDKKQLQNLSDKHLGELEAVIKRFLTHCPGRTGNIKREHVEAFVRDLHHEQLSSTTVHDRFVKIRTFLRWCVKMGYAKRDVSKGVSVPKPVATSTDRRRVIEITELRKLRFRREIYRWMTVALWGTGIRLGELRRLQPYQIHAAEKVVHIATPTKGRVSRDVPIADDVIVQALIKCCEHKANFGHLPSEPTFTKQLRRACDKAKIAPVTAHALRHSWITLVLAGGMDPATVQKIAGHTLIETTMKYAHPLLGKVKMPPSGLESSEEEKTEDLNTEGDEE